MPRVQHQQLLVRAHPQGEILLHAGASGAGSQRGGRGE